MLITYIYIIYYNFKFQNKHYNFRWFEMSLVKPDVEKEIYWINKDKTRFYYDKYKFGRDSVFANGKIRYECIVKGCSSAITLKSMKNIS